MLATSQCCLSPEPEEVEEMVSSAQEAFEFDGLFVNAAPLGFAAGDMNLFRYVENGPTGAVDPNGLFDTEMFWKNVNQLAPGVKKWFDRHGGQVRQGDYWSNASAAWEGYTPIVWLETDYNELQAAEAFIDRVQNSLELGGHYQAEVKVGTNLDFASFQKWHLQRTAIAAQTGAEAYLSFLSIANEGADWVITANDIKDNIQKREYFRAGLASASFLPFIAGGMIRVVFDHAENLIIPNALRRYMDTGQLGKGFANHEELVAHLGRAGDNHSWHHLVQKHDANELKFGAQSIHNEANVIGLPNHVHAEITAFQNSINYNVTGSRTLTVYEWIAKKSYEEQWAFGRALVDHVLTGNPLVYP